MYGNFRTLSDITQTEGHIRAAHLVDEPAAARTDEQLMLLAQAGDGDAFRRLFEAYRSRVWGFFRRRVGQRDRAEELAQDVFAALLESTPRYRPSGAFRSYLFGIAYNVLMADRRRRALIAEPLGDRDIAAPSADADAALWVRRALAQLDPVDREILMLREYEQLSYQEIAELRSLPLNTVRSRLFRARMALREILLDGGGVKPATTP